MIIPQILIVEDDLTLAEAMVEFLKENDLSVIHTANGAMALPLYEKYSPTVVILDIQLPNKSGFEIIEEIHQQDQVTPIFLMTGADYEYEIEKQIKGYKLGAINFLKKPIFLEVLLAQIMNVLETNTPPTRTYTIKDCKIIIQGQEIRVNDDTSIIIRNKDSLILAYLLENKNHIITKDKILRHVWNDTKLKNVNSLNAAISRLRKILAPYNIQITNVYGNGYIFS
mgnify:CR=1 FL=1